jgi:hypothetical protein
MFLNKIGFNNILAVFPTLERDERLDLVQQLEQSAQANIDFLMMMVLSTSLASLGLLADSTAVVIGAMLVAPLMGPLVAAGYSLVQGNLILFRKSLGVTFIGIGIGFAASLIFGRSIPDSNQRLRSKHAARLICWISVSRFFPE